MLKRLILMVILLLVTVSAVVSQDQLTATIGDNINLNVRQTPSLDGARITTLPPATTVIVDGRNEFGDWLLIRTQDGAIRGWVAIGFVQLSRPVRVMEEIPFVQAPTVFCTDL